MKQKFKIGYRVTWRAEAGHFGRRTEKYRQVRGGIMDRTQMTPPSGSDGLLAKWRDVCETLR